MTRNFIVNIHRDPNNTNQLITSPDPAVIMVGDKIRWFSDIGNHTGDILNILDILGTPAQGAFRGNPWQGRRDGLSNEVTALSEGVFKYQVIVQDGQVTLQADPVVIVS
jgi:hypothetical protein